MLYRKRNVIEKATIIIYAQNKKKRFVKKKSQYIIQNPSKRY